MMRQEMKNPTSKLTGEQADRVAWVLEACERSLRLWL
jgi:hypothetical protein